ncbi:MAG TPA: hypothetical protein VGE52_03460, partial [Pirellulales bacterium]
MFRTIRSLLAALAVSATAGTALAQFPPLPGGPPKPPGNGAKAGGSTKPSTPAAPFAPPSGDANTSAGAGAAGLPEPFDKVLGLLGPGQAEKIGQDLGDAIRGVSLYPERTRTAILTLAKYAHDDPKLIGNIAALRSVKQPAEVDRYLASQKYPDELQYAAAVVLVDTPETLDRMLAR